MQREHRKHWVLIDAATAQRAERVPGGDALLLTREEIGSHDLSTGVTTFQPGTGLYWHVHVVDESVTVLEGTPICEVGGQGGEIESHQVQPYDTTFIPAYTPHRFFNPTEGIVRILWSYPAGNVERLRVNPDGSPADR